MLELLNDILGIGLILIVVAYLYKWIKKKRNDGTFNKSNTNIYYESDILCGEVVDIRTDEITGFTRIEVSDARGVSKYGFSTMSVDELELLYEGKGYVRIPIIARRTVTKK